MASDFGRDVRNIVGSHAYADLFDVHLAEDSSAANRWHTQQRGMYAAAGVGTATTDRGAHVFSIDDPVKDRESADSEVIRERNWRWYTSTAYTRLESDIDTSEILEDDWLWRDLLRDIEAGRATKLEGAIILVQTRWHDDDLAGRLQLEQRRGGDQWDILDLPAVREEGETRIALWPSKYPLRRLDEIRIAIGERDFSALYQQRPAPDEGVYFKRVWFNLYDAPPQHLAIYGGSDYATKADGGDYTVHAVIGIDPNDNMYVLEMWREQTTPDIWIERFCDLLLKHKPYAWGAPRDQIKRSLEPFIKKRMEERKAYCQIEEISEAGSKPEKARSFQGRAAMGKVYLPRNAPWVGDLLAELLNFPAGRHDDFVDALAVIGRMLEAMVGASVPKEIEDEHGDGGYRILGGDLDGHIPSLEDGDSWRTL
jgi:predicted phage terminase large subunit-like protein